MTDQKTEQNTENQTDGVHIESHPTVKAAPSPVAQVAQSKGVLATAVTRNGSTIANRAVTEDDIVNVKGVTMPVSSAIQTGFLRKDDNGDIVDVSEEEAAAALDSGRAAEAERKKAQDMADLEEHGIDIDSDSQSFLTQTTQALEEVGGDPVSALVEWMRAPEKLPDVLDSAVRAKGGNPDEALAKLEASYERIQTRVEDMLVKKAGASHEDMPAFWQWARENKMHELRNAALQLPFTGDARQYVKLMQDFRKATGGKATNRAETVATVKNGGHVQEYVNIEGFGPVLREAAIKMGLIQA